MTKYIVYTFGTIRCYWEHVEHPLGTSNGGSNVGNILRTHWELVEDPMLGTCWGPIGNLWRIQYWEHVEHPLGTSSGGSNVGNILRTHGELQVEDPMLGTCWGPIGNLWRIQYWEHVEDPFGTCGASNVGNILKTNTPRKFLQVFYVLRVRPLDEWGQYHNKEHGETIADHLQNQFWQYPPIVEENCIG